MTAKPNLTTYDIARQIVEEYDPDGYGRATLTHDADGNWRLELVTGGWSDNEEFIGNLRARPDDVRQSRWMFWMVCWESSHRGGLFVFTGRLDQPFYGGQ